MAQGVGAMDLPDAIHEQGRRIRKLMDLAADGGARLVLFTEGALSGLPATRLMSGDPDRPAEADWSRVDWQALHAERQRTIERAGELGLWTVVGSLHRDPASAVRSTACT